MNLAIRQTSDGSHTLCNLDLNETYHSIHGAVNESIHVFIQAGLEWVLARQDKVAILEVGFGTGLNALLTAKKALEMNSQIDYTSLEPYPVPMEVAEQLNYADHFEDKASYKELLLKLHAVPWEAPQEIIPGFHLRKVRTTLEMFDNQGKNYDLIYFDPFPPSAQPYLWDKSALTKLANMLTPKGILTTYGAMGQFKRDLKGLGLEVQSLPGPPGKREMTRAIKQE